MKHFKLLSMLLAAASLLLASCSIDNLSSNEINDGEECLVSFAIQIPGDIAAKTRSNTGNAPLPEEPEEEIPEAPAEGEEPEEPEGSDTPTVPVDRITPGGGTMVKKLSYFVYKVTDYRNEFEATCAPTETFGTIDLTGLTASLNITLVKGVRYRIVFWADSFGLAEGTDSPYSFDMETGKLSIDFDKIESNRENLDAFRSLIDIEDPSAGIVHNVTLRRPFAQLNIGADLRKIEKLAVDKNSITTGIEVQCANAIYLTETWDDIRSHDITTRTFKIAPLPTNYKFPVEPETYEYLSLNYILVPYQEWVESTPVKFNFEIDGSATSRTINVPLESNFRTNVYGDLLTATSEVNITINPMFWLDHGDYNYEAEQVSSPLHEAGKTGGEFTLTEDLMISKPVVVSSDNHLIVDLNRYTLSKTSNETGINSVFELESGASLTIKGFGHVKALGERSSNYIVRGSSSRSYLFIEGGSYEGQFGMYYSSNITLYGGGFKNYNDLNLSGCVAEGLELRQLGEWSCVIKDGFDTSVADGGWGVDWETLSSLMGHQSDFHQPTYVYSNSGVTYVVSWDDVDAYASSSGENIVLGLGGGMSSFTAHDGIRGISDYAFYNCGELGLSGGVVTLPSSLESIGKYAFAYSGLYNLTIPENVTSIGEGAFQRCWSLENINIPEGVTKIEKETFENTSITSIVLPSSVTSIGEGAFRQCYELESINIPDGVTRIEKEAFECTSLSTIYFPASVKYFGPRCCARFSALQTVIIRATEFTIDPTMFDDPRTYGGPYEINIYVENSEVTKVSKVFENNNNIHVHRNFDYRY